MAEVELFGETFGTADKVGLMPLMRFAKVAQGGKDSGDMDGLAALYDLLQQCIASDDWQRFQDAADREQADGEELMGVIGTVFEALSARPTRQPSDSSAGQEVTPPNSGGDSYLRVVKRLEGEGRPDRALMVEMANGAALTG